MKHIFLIVTLAFSLTTFAQSPKTSAPFELFGDHIFVKLSVDGSDPLDFIFDTGDGLAVIDIDVAKSLNLDLDHKQATTSAQGSITGALIKHNKVQINDFTLESNIKIYATDLDHLEISIGRNIDGIIGYDMLRHHVVRLDYGTMQLEVYEGAYPKSGEELSFKLHNAIPTITGYCTLNNGESVSGSFYLNTGAGTTLDFNTPFAKANGIIDKTGDHYSYLVKGLTDKETRHYEGKVSSFRFGTFNIDELPIGISQVESGIQGDKKLAGIVGNRILSRFNILFDYKAGKLYLEENANAQKALSVNCSGIDVQMSKDMSKVLIHQVIDDSPASAAGIAVNSELVSINGQTAADASLPDIKKMLKAEGETVKLVVSQDGSEKEVELSLKSLL